MNNRPEPLPLVIGIGNPMRGDDGAGHAVADLLRERLNGRIDVEWHWGEGTRLMQAWEGRKQVILIDAAQSGVSAGTIHRFDASAEDIPAGFLHYSTHRFGVAEAVSLSRELGHLPGQLTLYAIEAKNFDQGAPLSEEVSEAIGCLVPIICTLIMGDTPKPGYTIDPNHR